MTSTVTIKMVVAVMITEVIIRQIRKAARSIDE